MKFRLSSQFGALEEVRKGKAHNGIDLAMPEGTELRSIAEGIVERVVDYGSQNIGKGVIIRIEDGSRLIYGHMSNVSVSTGEKVNAGELIGLSGNTGYSTGAHLHFGLWKDGEYINPTPLAEHLAEMSGEVTNISGWSLFQANGMLTQLASQTLKGHMRAEVESILMTFLEVVRDIIVELSFAVALLGGGISIILAAIGVKKGKVWCGVLVVAHVIIKMLLGGYAV